MAKESDLSRKSIPLSSAENDILREFAETENQICFLIEYDGVTDMLGQGQLLFFMRKPLTYYAAYCSIGDAQLGNGLHLTHTSTPEEIPPDGTPNLGVFVRTDRDNTLSITFGIKFFIKGATIGDKLHLQREMNPSPIKRLTLFVWMGDSLVSVYHNNDMVGTDFDIPLAW